MVTTVFASVIIHAQESDYQTLLREDRVWVNSMNNISDIPEDEFSYTYSYFLNGDTIINGIKYKKCYMHVDDEENAKNTTSCGYHFVWDNTKAVAYLREEGNKVYALPELFDALPIEVLSYSKETKDYLLYDFGAYESTYTVGQIDIAGTACKSYSSELGTIYIESIGAVNYGTLLVPEWPVSTCTTFNMSALSHVTDRQGNIVYKSPNFRGGNSSIKDITTSSKENNALYYNLHGQAVDIKSAPAGIYIHGGKKVVVK